MQTTETPKPISSNILALRILAILMVLFGVFSAAKLTLTVVDIVQDYGRNADALYLVVGALPLAITAVAPYICLGLLLGLSKNPRTIARTLGIMVFILSLTCLSGIFALFDLADPDNAKFAPAIFLGSLLGIVAVLKVKGDVRRFMEGAGSH